MICAVTALAGVACNLAPPLHVPQVESVQRAIREPREERAMAYDRCTREALAEPGGDQDELITCMKAAGFGLLAVAADHRRSHCLAALEAPDVLPDAFCFQSLE
jgi:hypothetical protein